MNEYCQIIINAPSKIEAKKIADELLRTKLVAGTSIYEAPSKYWWNGKIEVHKYFNISAFSLMSNKEKIISLTTKIHSDECPCLVFIPIDGNSAFLDWIKKYSK